MPIRRIADCAEVLPGFSLRGRVQHDAKGTHQVILARRVAEGTPYVYDPADELRVVPARDARRYLVRAGDVLFISRGTRNIAVRIESIPERTIVPLTFYVLRAGEELDPGYLAWCINQPPVQAAIAQVRTGGGAPQVPRPALGDIRIPIPLLDVQRKIARLGSLMGRERQLTERLVAETRRAHRLVGDLVARSLSSGGEAAKERIGR